jgi:PAS domain S-box-containing protein
VIVWTFSLWTYDRQARAQWREERDERLELTLRILAGNISRSVRQDLSSVERMLLTWLNTQSVPNEVIREERINRIARQGHFLSHRVLERDRGRSWVAVAGHRGARAAPLDPVLANQALRGNLVIGPAVPRGDREAETLLYAGTVVEEGKLILVEARWLLTPETLNPLRWEDLENMVWGLRSRSGDVIFETPPGGMTDQALTMEVNVAPWLAWMLTFEPMPAWYTGEAQLSRLIWIVGGFAMLLSIGFLIHIETKNRDLVGLADESIETTALLETVLDGSENYSIIATDLSGKIVRANRGTHRLYGHPAPLLIGKPIAGLSHPQAPAEDRLDQILRTTLESGRYDDVVAVRRADGTMFHVQLSCAVRTDAEARPIGFVLITHDVTALLDRTIRLEQLNAQLAEQTRVAQRASRMVNEFLANMSHELRTPLNAILGYTRLVQRKTADQIAPRQAENLAKILRSGESLLGLINDLLDLSKIEAGRMPIQCEPVSLAKVVEEVVDTVRPLAQGQRDKVTLDVAADLPQMVSDKSHIRQIVMNLVANAIKFTSKGTIHVQIRRGRDPETVQLQVADSGVGIPEEQLPHIFEAFYQVSGKDTAGESGTGLGLSIVQRLVHRLGGEITVDSRLGEGTTFMVTLPLDITAPGVEPALPPEPMAPPG